MVLVFRFNPSLQAAFRLLRKLKNYEFVVQCYFQKFSARGNIPRSLIEHSYLERREPAPITIVVRSVGG